jgi:hypothetical protein
MPPTPQPPIPNPQSPIPKKSKDIILNFFNIYIYENKNLNFV